MNIILSITLSAAAMQLAIAGSEEAESILKKMESIARGLRDELESAYTTRCETGTLTECRGQNFNDCSSMFPDPVCRLNYGKAQIPPPTCECGTQWDTSISTITMSASLLGENELPKDDKVIETICYSRLAEQYIVDSFHDEFWAEHDVEPAAILFGSSNGVFRRFPAKHTKECWAYDPRSRPWYADASSPSKDVVIVIDRSRSMNGTNLQLAQEAAITIIDTLAKSDRVAVVTFSSDASVLAVDDVLLEDNILVGATDGDRKDKLITAIKTINITDETSNLYNAFNLTFDILSNSITRGNSSSCNNVIIIFTDGKVDDGMSEEDTSKVISLVDDQSEQLAINFNTKPFLFIYTVGEDAGINITKTIACGTGGIWRHVRDEESADLISALSSYYKLFELGLPTGENDDFVVWAEPFFWYHDNRFGTTVTVPVFDRKVSPYLLLGVAGVGIYMDSIERILGSDASNAWLHETSWFRQWMMESPSVEGCPAINLTKCQLDALRFLGGGEDATCGLCNDTSSYTRFLPEVCPSNTTVPTDLWQNKEYEAEPYSERGCCNVASELCLATSGSNKSTGNTEGRWILPNVVTATTFYVASAFALFI